MQTKCSENGRATKRCIQNESERVERGLASLHAASTIAQTNAEDLKSENLMLLHDEPFTGKITFVRLLWVYHRVWGLRFGLGSSGEAPTEDRVEPRKEPLEGPVLWRLKSFAALLFVPWAK